MLFLDNFWIDESEIDAIDGSEPVISIPDDELGPTIVNDELMDETFCIINSRAFTPDCFDNIYTSMINRTFVKYR